MAIISYELPNSNAVFLPSNSRAKSEAVVYYDRKMKVKLFIRAKLKEAIGGEHFIWCKKVGLYEILSDDKCFGECSIDRLVLFARRAAECGIMIRLDMNDIDGFLSRVESWQIDKWGIGYVKCLARESRSERKRFKINGDKISEWENKGDYAFTKDDLEFGANEVENEVRTHVSKVRKITVFTPPIDLRGVFVPIEDTIDFKVTRAKAELDALVSEKDELESKDGNDAETIRRLEELGAMILEARDKVAMLESPSSEHNLCMFGGVQPSSFVRGQNQSADDLRNFGVWEDADYRKD